MEIPVLAVKCRFCGEEVGRPRDETRQLSVKDLGGETIQHYTPSDSVMDAIEAYRAEMQAEQAAAEDAARKTRKSFFRRRQPDPPPPPQQTVDDLPIAPPPLETDAPPPLTAADFAVPPLSRSTPPPAPQTLAHRAAFWGAMAAIAVVVILGAFQALTVVQGFFVREEPPGPSGFVNRAPAIIQRGGPPLEALEAAVEALQHDQTDRNREIADQAAQLVAAQVEDLLNAVQWLPENVLTASQIAHRASDLYPTAAMRQLREQAKEEVFLYQMNLVSADRDEGEAVLSITARDGRRDRVEVAVGDTIQERFVLQRVAADRIVLEDAQRLSRHGRNRTVTVTRTGVQ